MNAAKWPDTPADVAAVRAEIEAEIAGSTLLTAYAGTVAENPDCLAHQWLQAGEWRTATYREVYDHVRDAALGLAETGLAPGDCAVIWAKNSPQATIADYAVMHARATPVFIYTTVAADQAAYITAHCEATVALVDREFLGKLDSVRDQLPGLKRIVVLDAEPGEQFGPGSEAGPVGWAELLDLGDAAAEANPDLFDRTWRQVGPEDLATLIYTSGTTGQPKATMLTHHNIRYYQLSSVRVNSRESISDDDGNTRLISYLPLAHVTGRALDNWSPMSHPVSIAYCQEIPRLFEVAASFRPTALVGVPRVWEKLHAAVSARLPDSSPEAVRALPEQVKRTVLTLIGLDQCRFAASGAAPIDPEIIEFFHALGVIMVEGWGMSELALSGTATAHDRYRRGSVGQPVPGAEARIAEDGELLYRSPHVMRGYFKDPELTAATIDSDGWLHTGDIAEVDEDGFLKIVDRKKELIITSGGKNISPALIEYELQRHPLIGQACAIGDRRSYVAALLVLDPEAAPAWARAHGIEATGTVALSAADLAAHPDVLAEIDQAVAAANSHLARPEQVRRYQVLPNEWTPQSGELTPSLKRRRRVIIDKYAKEIESLYE
jgi:long-chain acyl-CoA synthetase